MNDHLKRPSATDHLHTLNVITEGNGALPTAEFFERAIRAYHEGRIGLSDVKGVVNYLVSEGLLQETI